MNILDLMQEMKSNAVDDTISRLGIQTSPRKVVTCFNAVLHELPGGALRLLRDDRFQVVVVPYSTGTGVMRVYFPKSLRRIAGFVDLRPTTRLVLAINASGVEVRPVGETEKDLRHTIGHVLLYLREPHAPNECVDADREWKDWSQIANSLAA
jgi:hypothetical protein